MDARAGVSSTTISNKVQLSPETFESDGMGLGGWGVGERGRAEQNVGDTGNGGTGQDGRVYTVPLRERETGRDDNLNDRKVGCRNAPKLAITGWRGDNGG